MANSAKVKNTLATMVMLGVVGGTVFWAFGDNFTQAAVPKNKLNVPDGYIHQKTTDTGSEVVHQYKKAPPTKTTDMQNADQAYSRYVDGLPDNLEKSIASEFRTLSVSYQNARLYADTTGLIRQGKENMESLRKLKGKQEEVQKIEALNKNDTGLIVTRPTTIEPEINPVTTGNNEFSLHDVKLEGVSGDSSGYSVLLLTQAGKMVSRQAGQMFGDFKVEKVSMKQVVISNGNEQRSIPVM